jgi:hypothetical protein
VNNSAILKSNSSDQGNTKQSVDYLKEQRIKRLQQEADGIGRQQTMMNDLDKLMKRPNLSELERLEIVRKRAEAIEKQARREEKLIRQEQGSGGGDIERSIAVNDRYMEAINAKLRILDQI